MSSRGLVPVGSQFIPQRPREHLSAWRAPTAPRRIQGLDMSFQWAPQARRFPIEAGDCPSSAVPPERQEPIDAEQPVG
ncbi:PREDICTED: protein FAM229A, partial [Tauraco erythrolophus]|uniref:protein FAM229A n=1 Tax=Tauraco erythrolophus TaxID=121530 RepID=UPI0005237BBA